MHPIRFLAKCIGTLIIICRIQEPIKKIFPISSPYLCKLELERSELYDSESFVLKAGEGESKIVELFLGSEMDNNIHAPDDRDAPLIAAAREGQEHIVKLLLQHEQGRRGNPLLWIGLILIAWASLAFVLDCFGSEKLPESMDGVLLYFPMCGVFIGVPLGITCLVIGMLQRQKEKKSGQAAGAAAVQNQDYAQRRDQRQLARNVNINIKNANGDTPLIV